ncbi:MFS transporter [Mobilicoccus caccae]|uniref:MFS transporter n=1 Tax=Mobilicoccus caccae TaxID=1859295 RepID=A0ABQ6IZF7_9MICO|nr:MFS transporter [Mobilicoccus caccae]GMA42104.1 MFS transporter [Mobilicoccus caccae]
MRFRQHLADTRPLQNPYFRRLWTANIVTVIGAQLTIVAVPAQIYVITSSSAYVGLTGLFGLVPLVVFGLWGGALADVFDRRTILLITTWGLIITTAGFWLQALLGNQNVWLLLGLFAVQQAFFAVNQPTRSAVLPKILTPDLLPAANSLSMTLFGAGAVVGPLLGGVLIPVLGFSWLYLIDTLCLFATLWAVISLPPLPVEGAEGRPGLRSVVDGFVYLRGHPVLLMSFVVDIIAMFFGMPRALFPEVADVSFGGPPGGGLAYAVLFAAMPAGMVFGGVVSGWVSRVQRQGLAVVVSIVVWGAAVVVLGLAVLAADGRAGFWLAVAAVALAVGGAADMASAAFRQSMLQASATDAVRGRLQGVFIVVVAGGPRLADVAHGAASPVIGPGWTITAGGLLVIVGVVLASALAPVFVRYRG